MGAGVDQLPGGVDVRNGLSQQQAQRLLDEFGRNELPAHRTVPLWRRVVAQLRDPLIMVLLGAMALTLVSGDVSDAIVIGLVIVVNTTVGVIQEVRAANAIAALTRLVAPAARVRRDGRDQMVPAAEIVPGDVVLLGEGDIIPADGVLLGGPGLLVDESALTGESVPVDKSAGQAEDTSSALSAGTVVVRGRGVTQVTATGTHSALGRIAALLDTTPTPTPLQQRLAGLGRVLAIGALALSAVVLVLGLVRGQSLEFMVVTALSLAVAAVPESLPAVVTLSLALGAHRMAQRNAIVRALPAVETLGSVTVIATDKTGTLTEGRMVVERLWTPAGEASVTGGGYSPYGEVRHDGTPLVMDPALTRRVAGSAGAGATGAESLETVVARMLVAVTACNDARLVPPHDTDGRWEAIGDPTEAALLAAAGKAGLDPDVVHAVLPRLAEIPFDSQRKRMTTAHRAPDGALVVYLKGAPEVLLAPGVLADDTSLTVPAAQAAHRLAGEGYRVLAVAEARVHPDDSARSGSDAVDQEALAAAEGHARLLGLVGILDPPRATAADTVRACRRAGILPVLITGDHPATAGAIARRLGLLDSGEVATGADLREGHVDDVTSVRVFARTTPEQKLDIVRAWQAAGQVVAMTGDGVNDGPALRAADIGVAMGGRGTEVARQAADLVLADDELGTVVAAVEEGRRIYDNVRRFLAYGLSGGVAEILVMLVGPFIGLPVPLLPGQILWVNLMTHGLPGVALGAEPVEPDAMDRPPRPPQESVLGAGLWQRVARLGTVVTLVCLLLATAAAQAGREWQTMLFLTLAVTQLGVALGSRARPGSRENPSLLFAVAGALALQLAGIYAPGLSDVLGTVALPPIDLAVAAVGLPVGYLAMRVEKRLERRRRH